MKALEFVWLDNATGHPRMGLIVPKFQSTAVARNRLRRQLSEIWRREVQGRQGSLDLLVRARPFAYGTSFRDLRGEMLAWVEARCGQ